MNSCLLERQIFVCSYLLLRIIKNVLIHEQEKIVVEKLEGYDRGERHRAESGTVIAYHSLCITVVGIGNTVSSPIRKL